MVFHSTEFLLFFPIVIALFYSLKSYKHRVWMLLIAGYIFYMAWKPAYIVLILISTLIDYYVAIGITKTNQELRRKLLLALSLAVNLGLLFTYKYLDFFISSVNGFSNFAGLSVNLPYADLILPMGISFYTFQTLSYTIDVYRKQIQPEYDFKRFALYVSFFPQLVAGPIERAGNLLGQMYEWKKFDYIKVTAGAKLMAWGFFKKLVIADRLAVAVNYVYADPSNSDSLALILATVFFAIQIYCDFSGYSDIAIGAAQMLGISLMDNFRRPYHAQNISDFWRRWHISLSTWFRDYVYIPLGGNRAGKFRWLSNLFITFFISGLWHGANWTFLAWGALHGFYLIFGIISKPFREKLITYSGLSQFWGMKYIRIVINFVLVCFAWIFFRAESIADACAVLNGMTKSTNVNDFYSLAAALGLKPQELILGVFFMILLEIAHLVQRGGSLRNMLSNQPAYIRWIFYYAIVFAIILFGEFDKTEFIYFQF